MPHELTDAEKFFFENNGYLVLENFLETSHVATLRDALAEVIEQAARTRGERSIPRPG